jgi:hypothetical protein
VKPPWECTIPLLRGRRPREEARTPDARTYTAGRALRTAKPQAVPDYSDRALQQRKSAACQGRASALTFPQAEA